MSKITALDNKILFQMRDETILIEAYGDNCIRVRASKNTILSDEAWTLLPPTESNPTIIPTDDGLYMLQNGMLSVKISRIWQACKITFYKNGQKILETREEGDSVRKYRHTEGSHYTIKALFEANPGEHIYGLGQTMQLLRQKRLFFRADTLQYQISHAGYLLFTRLRIFLEQSGNRAL